MTPEPRPSPSNRVADDPRAVELGKRLFFDARLSGAGDLACSSCHQPERAFTDGKKRGLGAGRALRNTPTLLGASHFSWFYWDGRRDSLWSQALLPLEAQEEMASTRTSVLRLVAEDVSYRKGIEGLFGTMPSASWFRSLPRRAGPYADAAAREAWMKMDARQRSRVNRIYAQVGKAIAAYERTLMPARTRFDAFVEAVRRGHSTEGLLSEQEQRGLRLFISDDSLCLRCHNGPFFSNGGFHNIGTANREGRNLDFGRAFGLRAVRMDEFNCLGPYSDAKPEECSALRFLSRSEDNHLEGAFKVPTLRRVSETAPYFHDGRFETLEEVVSFYNEPNLRVDGVELAPLNLDAAQVEALVAFLEIL